jgi:ATP-dependent helicase HrpB
MRVPRFDPGGGMTRLETVKVSQASADQRRGRAGRLEPGVCYRLWPEAEHKALARYSVPEILATDLAPLALELACWGADAAQLAWLDPPPDAAFKQARDLLTRLDALDAQGQVTAHGRAMARFGLHPRLAHMILAADARGHGGLACDIAAVLSARDLVKVHGGPQARDADLRLRLEIILGATRDADLRGLSIDRGMLHQVRQQAKDWRRRIKAGDERGDSDDAGLVLAEAYPDRVAQKRSGGNGQFLLSNGRGAVLPATDPLANADYLAVADLDGDKREARIFLAAPLTLAEIESDFADRIVKSDRAGWDAREGAVVARRQVKFGELVLCEEALPSPSPEQITAGMLDGIREIGLSALPWNKDTEVWRARVAFLRATYGAEAGWPDLSDASLLASLEDWLAPHLGGITRLSQLGRLDLMTVLKTQLDWDRQKKLDALAPSHLTVPSGSRHPIDYRDGTPTLAVRMQEMFGSVTTPTVADGKVPLRLHLLSPAGRPLQVTSDLAGFWANSYKSVRSEMRGRYPKHPWPEDPRNAEPTTRVKRRPT